MGCVIFGDAAAKFDLESSEKFRSSSCKPCDTGTYASHNASQTRQACVLQCDKRTGNHCNLPFHGNKYRGCGRFGFNDALKTQEPAANSLVEGAGTADLGRTRFVCRGAMNVREPATNPALTRTSTTGRTVM